VGDGKWMEEEKEGDRFPSHARSSPTFSRGCANVLVNGRVFNPEIPGLSIPVQPKPGISGLKKAYI